MKKQLLLLGFCLVASLNFAQERLIGHVKNAKAEYVVVERPFEGKYLPGMAENLPIGAGGKFEIELKDGSSGFLLIRMDGQKLRVFVQPDGQTDEFVADAKDLSGTVKFTGPHAAQNQFLQTLPRLDLNGRKLSEVNNPFFKAGDNPKDTWNLVNDYLESEKKLLKKTAKDGFSASFVDAVEHDIDAYYRSIFSSVAYRQWQAALKQVPYRFDSGWSNYWKKAVADSCLDDISAAVSEWYLVFLEQYIREYQLDFMKDSEFADADLARGEQFLEYDRLIWKYLKPKVQEYASAGILSDAALKGKGEPILVELKEKLETDFPDSKYLAHLETLLANASNSAGAGQGGEPMHVFVPGINVIGVDQEINSIREMIATFKGKVVYVDIWATWCAPCMFEMSHHEPLDKFAKGKDIVLLYVSVDDEERRAKWQKVIEDKNLTGYHILTNYALRDELIQQFGDGQNLALPTYLIFDKKGKLVEREAKQPSHNTLLFNQLSQYLK
ncbi:MAG: TlpA family protein disulfide reductase [Saprospiraceae bacterium]|nr:TlpA family protein disulfide reductase [Saprospiraceae bacterium]